MPVSAPALNEGELAAWQGYVFSHATLMRDLDALLRATAGMSVAAYAVLHLLTREPGGSLRISELAERTRLTVSGISRIVATLCEQGLAERRPDHEDGRAWRIALTAEGAAQVAEVLPVATSFVRERFTERFSEEELVAIRRFCERLEEP